MKNKHINGFSLVELMVGMVIALLGIIIIFQMFSVSENNKSTNTSGADAQQNGALALYLLEREIMMAGYGIMRTASLGCTIRSWRNGGANTSILAPVVINSGYMRAALPAPAGFQLLVDWRKI